MAPEVVNRKGHTFAADWWSFGVLMVIYAYKLMHLLKKHKINFSFLVRNVDWKFTIPRCESTRHNESNSEN
jgi:serine/threonine protein kinase